MFGAVSSCQVVADRRVAGRVLKKIRVALQLLKLGRVKAGLFALLLVAFDELDDAIRLGKWQGTKKDAVDDSEDRRVCADAEREGQYSDDRKGWGFCQNTQSVTKVLPKGHHTAPRGRCGLPRLMSGAFAERFLHSKRGAVGNSFRPQPPGYQRVHMVDTDSLVGQTVSHYRILEKLGRRKALPANRILPD